jgi:hypothetical protein
MGEAEQTAARREAKPFERLVRHCMDRILHGDESASSGELEFGIGALLALLAMPGAFATVLMLEKYGSLFHFLNGITKFDAYAESLPDEYFFIVLAVVVTGAVAIWKWDTLIPGHRDYANLAPLPISSRNIFLANLTAVLALAAALALDVNAASAVLFPLIVCGSQSSFRYLGVFFVTHLAAVVLASIFSFFAVLAIMGLLMAVLPYRVFRRFSVYVRCGMMVFLMVILVTSFAMIQFVQNLPAHSRPLIKLMSPVWFLGLCQSLRGVPDAAFTSLGQVALAGTGIAFVVALGAYALSYRRCFTQNAEITARLPSAGGKVSRLAFRRLDSFLLNSPFQRACFRFTTKTLFRSENHALMVGGFAGLGIVLASQTLYEAAQARAAAAAHFLLPSALPPAELLSIPLILAYFLLLGVRLAFEIPVTLRANWLFRLNVNPETDECIPLARKVLLAFIVPLILLVCLPVCAWRWGWPLALTHAAVVALLCVLLIETLLLRFRKIPFTCVAPTFKSNALVIVLLYFLGFVIFTSWASTAERWALLAPLRFLAFIPLLAAGWLLLRRYRCEQTDLDRRLIFVETPSAAVEVLDLTFRR